MVRKRILRQKNILDVELNPFEWIYSTFGRENIILCNTPQFVINHDFSIILLFHFFILNTNQSSKVPSTRHIRHGISRHQMKFECSCVICLKWNRKWTHYFPEFYNLSGSSFWNKSGINLQGTNLKWICGHGGMTSKGTTLNLAIPRLTTSETAKSGWSIINGKKFT